MELPQTNTSQGNELLEAALNYLKRGASVVPVKQDKVPYVEWVDFQTRRPTEEEVRSWWTKWPDANIGLITGQISNVTVVDVENGGDISRFPITTTIQTGGGGWHLYYQYYPINNKTRIFHLTDIRGNGGYVVASPSIHASGNKYTILKDILPVPFPAEIFEEERARVHSNLNRLLNEVVSEGERNNTATSICGKLLLRFKEHEWDTQAWPLFQSWNTTHNDPPLSDRELQIIFNSISQAESRRNQSGQMVGEAILLEQGEDRYVINVPITDSFAVFEFEDVDYSTKSIEAIVRCSVETPGSVARKFVQRINILSNSAREAFTRQLKEAFPRGKGKEGWALVFSQACELLHETLKKQSKSDEYDDTLDVQTRYLLNPFIEEDAPNIIFGMGGSGKTYLSLRMGIAIALGESFLGSEPGIGASTIFVDYENTRAVWASRITKILRGMGYEPGSDVSKEIKKKIFYFATKGVPLHDLKQQLLDEKKKRNAKLLIIDSAALACGGEPESADVANRLFNAITRLDITVLMIAHETKGTANKTETPFGSVFFFNCARNIWNIQNRAEEGESVISVCLYHKKSNNDMKSRQREVKIKFVDGSVEMRETEGEWGKSTTVADQIVNTLDESEVSMTPLQIAEEIKEGADYVSKKLNILLRKGKVTRLSYGKYVLKGRENSTTVTEEGQE